MHVVAKSQKHTHTVIVTYTFYEDERIGIGGERIYRMMIDLLQSLQSRNVFSSMMMPSIRALYIILHAM